MFAIFNLLTKLFFIAEFQNIIDSCCILQLECELQSMRTAYEELQISFREREKLEYSTRTTMESKIGDLQENNSNLQGENVLSLETRIFAKMHVMSSLICFRAL